jgi:hypothetical protein
MAPRVPTASTLVAAVRREFEPVLGCAPRGGDGAEAGKGCQGGDQRALVRPSPALRTWVASSTPCARRSSGARRSRPSWPPSTGSGGLSSRSFRVDGSTSRGTRRASLRRGSLLTVIPPADRRWRADASTGGPCANPAPSRAHPHDSRRARPVPVRRSGPESNHGPMGPEAAGLRGERVLVRRRRVGSSAPSHEFPAPPPRATIRNRSPAHRDTGQTSLGEPRWPT